MAAVVVAREKPCSQALEQEELRTHRAHEARAKLSLDRKNQQ